MVARFISILCNVTAALFGWASFAVSIAAVTLTTWTEFGDREFGLFYYCFKSGSKQCFWVETEYDSLHWLRAVRAHVIIMIVLGGFGCLSNLASFAKQQEKNIKSSASLLLFLAGIAGVVGLSIYTGKKELDFSRYEYGSAFILGWIGAWGFLAAGLFQSFAGCFTTSYEVH